LLKHLEFITVYWLSGWFQEKFEIWKGKINPEEPSLLSILTTADGLSFSVDWFAGEEYPLKAFPSENRRELLLMSEFQRETVFLHLT
jgi:hypothetical protein